LLYFIAQDVPPQDVMLGKYNEAKMISHPAIPLLAQRVPNPQGMVDCGFEEN
jgi:hypothetical protein